VRELENTIERAVVLSSGRVMGEKDISVLAPPVTQAPPCRRCGCTRTSSGRSARACAGRSSSRAA
jgi:DNA-binding NtrC family response regulator